MGSREQAKEIVKTVLLDAGCDFMAEDSVKFVASKIAAKDAEIERLRRFVDWQDIRSDFRTATEMRTEIERLRAENQRYERLFTSREQDHKELCERYDQLEAENAILKAQLSTAQMSAIEHQAKYVTMHERHQGLWRENLNLKAQLSASEDNRRVLGAECGRARDILHESGQERNCNNVNAISVEIGQRAYKRARQATDAAKALEAP